MTSLLNSTRWMFLLAWCCWVNCLVLTARPISGEVATDEAVLSSSKSISMAADSRPGLSFPSAVSAELPFRGDTELLSSATRATGSVVLLVGLILVGTFVLKRYWPGRFGAVAGERHIEVLETVALGDRQSLTLVQVGQSRLLLARTAGSITLLDRVEVLPEAAVVGEIDAQAEQEGPRNCVPTVMPITVRVAKHIEALLKAVLARIGAVIRRLPTKSRNVPALKTPSFEQVMHAELAAAATPSTAPRSSGSRLSEIRNWLQAE